MRRDLFLSARLFAFEIFLAFFERHDVRVFVMRIEKIGILSERKSAKSSCVGLMTVDATGTLIIQFYQLVGLLRAAIDGQ